MIRYITKNLFDTDVFHIAHGCNSAGVMGSGVALGIRENFPKAFQSYHEFCGAHYKRIGDPKDLLGRVISIETDGKFIHNIITQLHYGKTGERFVSYDAIASGFSILNDSIGRSSHDNKLAIPRIGSGLGGGNWNIIEKIIEEYCPRLEVIVHDLETV